MRILVVDDDSEIRSVLRELLEAEDMTVFSAEDGLEALALLEREPVDAVITDILMPRMDGYRLCRELRKSEKYGSLPIIIYAGTYTSSGDAQTALQLGGCKFLKKPSLAAEIIRALHEAVKDAPGRQSKADLPGPEPDLMKQYNARLVTQLEQNNTRLEAQTKELLKAGQQLRLQATAMETAANAIVVTDRRGAICWVNPAFTVLTGYAADEALGKNPNLLKSGKHDRGFYQELWKTILAGQTWRGEFTNRRKNGALYFAEQTITPVRSYDGAITHFIGIINDITDRKRLEAQFIEAQKTEVIGRLAGGVAHDFNNILMVIQGNNDLVTSELGADNPLRKNTEQIRHACERATGLTRQLLVFSRKQKVQPVSLDLNDVLNDMEKMLRRLVDENIKTIILRGRESGRVKADSGYVGQVLMNLVVNARDAMPNGGKLTIAINNVTLDESYTCTHPGSVPGEYVMLSVSDTGIGMTDEIKAHLFEALFTTKPVGKGTGLGLATCQTIVQQSGGHIGVYSEVGVGTTFKVYFPRIEQPLEVAAQPVPPGPLPRGTETVLVVEDDPFVRDLACVVLKTQGYEVLVASNGQDGLQAVRSHKGSPIRLVVTDVIMPLMDGKVMANWLKVVYPDLKILFTSGYTDDAIAHHGVLAAGVEFLSKPYSPEVLARKVREMLDR